MGLYMNLPQTSMRLNYPLIYKQNMPVIPTDNFRGETIWFHAWITTRYALVYQKKLNEADENK